MTVFVCAPPEYVENIWTDLRNAAVCPDVQTWRAASFAAGARVLPGAPSPLDDCPATFGNTDIFAATTG